VLLSLAVRGKRLEMSSIALKLKGKVALITGAGSGIGAATAKLFTELGASITITGTTQSKLESTVATCKQAYVGQPKPIVIVGNITDANLRQKLVDDTIKTFGKLDILVNNAGIGRMTMLLETPIEVYDELFDVNVRSVIVLTQLASPHLIKTKGSVINISSVAAETVVKTRMFYSMSKIALNQFTKFAAQELGPHQVRVNTVSPGLIVTNFTSNYGLNPTSISKYYEDNKHSQVLGRPGEAVEIANTIAFLASDEASFITGSNIVVDGGFLVTPSHDLKMNT